MLCSWQTFNNIDTANEERDLLESWINGSIYEDVMRDLLIGLAIRRFKILRATNLLITLLDDKNTITT